MCSTTLILLSILAVTSLEASGTYLRRKYAQEDPFLNPYNSKPKTSPPFGSATGPLLGLRYPSRHSSINPTRPKPFNAHGPKPGVYANRPSTLSEKGTYPLRNGKPAVSSSVQSVRPRPIGNVAPKANIQYSAPAPNLVTPSKVEMKPVYEKGMFPRIPLYINAFAESAPSGSQNTNNASRTLNYEPLGNYAKF